MKTIKNIIMSDAITFSDSNREVNQGKIVKFKLNMNKINKNYKIVNGEIEFSYSSGVNPNSIQVNIKNGVVYKPIEIIDNINSNFKLNITNEINEFIKNSFIEFEMQSLSSAGYIKIGSSVNLNLDCIPKQINFLNNEYIESSIANGSSKVNINTGELTYSNILFSNCGLSINMPLAAIYRNKEWKLNLNKKLTSVSNSTSNGYLYSYIDEENNQHEFTEKYYYYYNDNKVYLDRESVTINLEGDYQFVLYGEKFEVKTETISTSGLKLISDKSEFDNPYKLQFKSQEYSQLEEELKLISKQKDEFKGAIKDCNNSLILLEQSKELQEIQKNIQEKNYDYENYSLYFTFIDNLLKLLAQKEININNNYDAILSLVNEIKLHNKLLTTKINDYESEYTSKNKINSLDIISKIESSYNNILSEIMLKFNNGDFSEELKITTEKETITLNPKETRIYDNDSILKIREDIFKESYSNNAEKDFKVYKKK